VQPGGTDSLSMDQDVPTAERRRPSESRAAFQVPWALGTPPHPVRSPEGSLRCTTTGLLPARRRGTAQTPRFRPAACAEGVPPAVAGRSSPRARGPIGRSTQPLRARPSRRARPPLPISRRCNARGSSRRGAATTTAPSPSRCPACAPHIAAAAPGHQAFCPRRLRRRCAVSLISSTIQKPHPGPRHRDTGAPRRLPKAALCC